jgi:hypothetical protein
MPPAPPTPSSLPSSATDIWGRAQFMKLLTEQLPPKQPLAATVNEVSDTDKIPRTHTNKAYYSLRKIFYYIVQFPERREISV